MGEMKGANPPIPQSTLRASDISQLAASSPGRRGRGRTMEAPTELVGSPYFHRTGTPAYSCLALARGIAFHVPREVANEASR
ncbi:hypothetical protein CONLIGDRAFT_629753 [Coniochaeta ligniaria NRRL 30616]|uniref:Uncharacterized protein n=1 Tax=Coniochaeta ligniaria NRRL 30616 TaxID=1408157 RepID=A0A1J7IXN2_9PEZI|nr:hypothetical protein CONLIGDRAFT_629753 [Coniochaeta ligniaria NRRL 30616]